LNRAVVGAGSNIEGRLHIAQAKELLSGEHRFIKESKFVVTSPIGFTDQPDFLNGAFLIETTLEIDEFRAYLKKVEDRLGRVRTPNKNGPRTIDLDLIVWNNEIVDNDYYEKDFVRNAISELLPELGRKFYSLKKSGRDERAPTSTNPGNPFNPGNPDQ
jgi:2-amino-4-hydroxy-6-hydroxymethyldihydropteridine diphosphokinase